MRCSSQCVQGWSSAVRRMCQRVCLAVPEHAWRHLCFVPEAPTAHASWTQLCWGSDHLPEIPTYPCPATSDRAQCGRIFVSSVLRLDALQACSCQFWVTRPQTASRSGLLTRCPDSRDSKMPRILNGFLTFFVKKLYEVTNKGLFKTPTHPEMRQIAISR